jgi:uncharacterized membrane protein YkoI
MMRVTRSATILWVLLLASAAAGEAADHRDSVERCVKAARAATPGGAAAVVKLEALTLNGVRLYEVEVLSASGVEWEFMCDARRGTIHEIEQEVKGPDDPKFKKHAKVTPDQAKAIVTGLYPGRIVEVEYEIEANGDATYEIDVDIGGGKELKIEVDAATGKIIEVAIEDWQIGVEPGETSR